MHPSPARRALDKLLDQRFSLGFYLERISRELGEASSEALLTKAQRAILSKTVGVLRCVAHVRR